MVSVQGGSKEYKKALRNHKKSTKDVRDASNDWTAFRAVEKKFKSRFPHPDLSDVLDLENLLNRQSLPVELTEICLSGLGPKTAFTVSTIPGLVLLPGFIDAPEQRNLIRLCLEHQTRNETNLSTHYHLPPEGLWKAHLTSPPTIIHPKSASEDCPDEPLGARKLINNPPASSSNFSELHSTPKPPASPSKGLTPVSADVLLARLRWTNIGYLYHWGTKSYDFTRKTPPVPSKLRDLCRNAVKSVPWEVVFGTEEGSRSWGESATDWRDWHNTYEPDAGIINSYQLRDTLMAHVDRSEVCSTSPLVSISLGHSAIFLIGGSTRDIAPKPILLRSGDVLIMSGPECRRAYHGVPRILERTLPDHLGSNAELEDGTDWKPFAKYISTARINVNVRQVFPTGFNPRIMKTNSSN